MRSVSDPGIEHGNTHSAETKEGERHPGSRPNTLYIVGIGPGDIEHLSGRAREVLESVEVIAGYKTYIDLIRPLIQGKTIISTGMTKEIDRVGTAIDEALKGKACAVVSSGDAGVYAMAGLVFEMCRTKQIPLLADDAEAKPGSLFVEAVPGIPALCAGASLLGAPLTHDFATISLSDLLTPWDVIEKRVEAAAMADFVIVLYNPKSKKRNWQLEATQKIILRHRSPDTPVGIVSRAMRDGQDVRIVPLDKLNEAAIDMQTTVFIGNSRTFTYSGYMVTPRGYSDKYEMI